MKYVKIKIQEQEQTNKVITGVHYVEYNNKLNSACIYTMDGLDNIYIEMDLKSYESLLNEIMRNNCTVIDKVGYVQPFEDFETGNKKAEQYIKIDQEIKEKARKLNAK